MKVATQSQSDTPLTTHHQTNPYFDNIVFEFCTNDFLREPRRHRRMKNRGKRHRKSRIMGEPLLCIEICWQFVIKDFQLHSLDHFLHSAYWFVGRSCSNNTNENLLFGFRFPVKLSIQFP